MSGFVDIHSHILWGLDDGPTDLATSLEMLRVAAATGTSDIVATPHSDLQYTFQPDEIQSRLQELAQAGGPMPRIHSGCDFHIHFDNVSDCLNHPAKYTINQQRYLMVEFSDANIPKSAGQIFDRMLQAGISPVVTHPERNSLLMSDLQQLVQWINAGCLMQVTAQSFHGRFGRQAQNAAEELMARSMVHFIASDAHDPVHRPPDLAPSYTSICQRYGEDTGNRLFRTNPGCTLTGQVFEIAMPDAARRRKWFQFW